MNSAESSNRRCEVLTVYVLALGLIFMWAAPGRAAPIGTAFTYQGHLYDANYAANGLYDFQFKLFNAPYAGDQEGGDVNKPGVDVIDGYFTVELDFGSDAFDGEARWLQIGVRPGEMNDPNIYTVLSPRQELTPTPCALSVKVPLELWEVSDEAVLGVVNTGDGYAVAAAAGVSPAVMGVCLANGNSGAIGDANGGVFGLAGDDSNAGYFKGDVALHGELVVADNNGIHFVHNGTILFEYDAGMEVYHDLGTYVGRDETRSIGGNLDTGVSMQETHTVTFNRTTTIGGSEICHIGGDWDVDAGGNMMVEANDIELNGNVSIGEFAPTACLDVDGNVRLRKPKAGTGTGLVVDANGFVYKYSSSEQYKEDIKTFTPDGEAVLALEPVKFRYKDTGQEDIGLIAEDVAKKISDLVIYDNQGRPDAVKYDRISLYLLDVVRELKKENEQLKNKINAIEKVVLNDRRDNL